MDYRVYHAVNQFVYHHAWIGRALSQIETWSVPLIATATVLLWFLARPGTASKWKLVSASALAAAALGLLVNQVIAAFWTRTRPFIAHPDAHVWGSPSHDPSFPSDHASAAFAIAITVFFFSRRVGIPFLALAVVIVVGRIVIGAHYPTDVIAGLAVGLICALAVVRLARPLLSPLVRLVAAASDTVTAPVWRLLDRRL